MKPTFLPLDFHWVAPRTSERRAHRLLKTMLQRRTIRTFSDRRVPRSVIKNCLRIAGSAPSGANMQPWKFVVISRTALRAKIKKAAEKEEQAFYKKRASTEWLQALGPLGTDWRKPFLVDAPYLIVIFAEKFGLRADGEHVKHYYVQESVGIATGFLIAALHQAGLATLTHTPSPMGFLNKILGRPNNERPFLLLVVGYPAVGTTVPSFAVERKPFKEIVIW
ncbi:MAG: nitroreductase family protein [SAR202 cluster bacterium]|nr:nitroreductase family protein [SAR202 cluster bacterium]